MAGAAASPCIVSIESFYFRFCRSASTPRGNVSPLPFGCVVGSVIYTRRRVLRLLVSRLRLLPLVFSRADLLRPSFVIIVPKASGGAAAAVAAAIAASALSALSTALAAASLNAAASIAGVLGA